MQELDIRKRQNELETQKRSYVLATVIKVRGSASAKPGSKMLISEKGENLCGWIGGGCAESFTIENALEALAEKTPRIIVADLDDEVFGLGMPCGGVMDIYLEPHFPAEKILFPWGINSRLAALTEHYGFQPIFAQATPETFSVSEAIQKLAHALAKTRNISPRALQEEKLGKRPSPSTLSLPPAEFLILGASRITEELALLSTLLEWKTRVYGISPTVGNYPNIARVEAARPNYENLNVQAGSVVVIASHHKGDAEYIRAALAADAQYIGLVASAKRAGIVFDFLRAQGVEEEKIARVHSPAGLDLACRNPGEIALSIVAQVIEFS